MAYGGLIGIYFSSFCQIQAACVYPDGKEIKCPDNSECMKAIGKGEPINASLNSYWKTDTVCCSKGQVSGETAAAAYGITVTVSDPSDRAVAQLYEQDDKCLCHLTDQDATDVGGGTMKVTWSGTVDRTKIGNYTVTATIRDQSTPCLGQTVDDSVTKSFTVAVSADPENPLPQSYPATPRNQENNIPINNTDSSLGCNIQNIVYSGEYDKIYGWIKKGAASQGSCEAPLEVEYQQSHEANSSLNIIPFNWIEISLSLSQGGSITNSTACPVRECAHSQSALYQEFVDIRADYTRTNYICSLPLEVNSVASFSKSRGYYLLSTTVACYYASNPANLPSPPNSIGGM